jgi:hypothetical protein
MPFTPELSASKVAGFIGLHKYQSSEEVWYELLKKDKATAAAIAELERTHKRRPFNHVLNDILKDQPIVDCISSGLRDAQKTKDVVRVLNDVEDQARIILGLRRDEISPEVRNRLAEEVRGKVAKNRGLANENNILDKYEVDKDVKVTERNTRMLRKDYGSFKIVGRTDGYVASENRIVDSKDRTRAWPTVPLYDEIQLRVYMNMTDAKESELIERFPDGSTRHTTYPNDPQKWKYIQDAIEKQVATLVLATESPEELKRIVYENTVAI